VNTVLGNIKTLLGGMYHVFAFKKYGQRYLGQIQYLLNRRYHLRPFLVRRARDAAKATPRLPKTTLGQSILLIRSHHGDRQRPQRRPLHAKTPA
jgi:hypothetical protein